jgi:hypothetical protein
VVSWKGPLARDTSNLTWTDLALPESRAALISAYGYPFLACGSDLHRLDGIQPKRILESYRLPSGPLSTLKNAGQAERGCLFANLGHLFLLTDSGCLLLFPAPLARRAEIAGRFRWQITLGRSLLLWGSLRDGPEGLYTVPLDDHNLQAGLAPGSENHAPVQPPVWSDSRIFWVTSEGRLMEFDGETLHDRGGPSPDPPEEILALAAGVPGGPSAGVYLLTRTSGLSAIHRFETQPDRWGSAWTSTSVPGRLVASRIWVTRDHFYLGRSGVSSLDVQTESPALMQFNPDALGQQPVERSFPQAWQLVDALMLSAPNETLMALLLRDPTYNATGLYLQPWGAASPTQIFREIGIAQAGLQFHDGWIIGLFARDLSSAWLKGFRP